MPCLPTLVWPGLLLHFLFSLRGQEQFQRNPDSYNGAVRENYTWSQDYTDLELKVPVPQHVVKGRQVSTAALQHPSGSTCRGPVSGPWAAPSSLPCLSSATNASTCLVNHAVLCEAVAALARLCSSSSSSLPAAFSVTSVHRAPVTSHLFCRPISRAENCRFCGDEWASHPELSRAIPWSGATPGWSCDVTAHLSELE